VRFTHVDSVGAGQNVGKAILLEDVINNLAIDPDYYLRSTLSYTLGSEMDLYKAIQSHLWMWLVWRSWSLFVPYIITYHATHRNASCRFIQGDAVREFNFFVRAHWRGPVEIFPSVITPIWYGRAVVEGYRVPHTQTHTHTRTHTHTHTSTSDTFHAWTQIRFSFSNSSITFSRVTVQWGSLKYVHESRHNEEIFLVQNELRERSGFWCKRDPYKQGHFFERDRGLEGE